MISASMHTGKAGGFANSAYAKRSKLMKDNSITESEQNNHNESNPFLHDIDG